MPSTLEQLVSTAVTLFMVLATSGLGGNIEAPKTQIPLKDYSRQEFVKDGIKSCDPPNVPPKSNP